MTRLQRALTWTAVSVVSLLAACGADADVADIRATEPNGDGSVAGDVTVFAAASLTDAFADIGVAFEAVFPDATVTFNFAGSSDLAAQILQAAPADVFAAADLSNMAKLASIDGGGAAEPAVFATNVAAIIVQAGNPSNIAELGDLADDDLIVVQCAPEVPCGRYADELYAQAGVAVVPKSFEENVKAVVTKVALGEADAGIVYATDVMGAGDAAEGVAIPADVNVVAEYPITVLPDAPNPAGARAFVDFVLGAAGQAVLTSYGFGAP